MVLKIRVELRGIALKSENLGGAFRIPGLGDAHSEFLLGLRVKGETRGDEKGEDAFHGAAGVEEHEFKQDRRDQSAGISKFPDDGFDVRPWKSKLM